MMLRAAFAVIAGLCISASASAQTTIDNTTLSAALSATAQQVNIASATCTGCTFGQGTILYVDAEALAVTGAYTSGTAGIPIIRGTNGTVATAHITGAVVWVGPPSRFHASDPVPLINYAGTGACTAAAYGPFRPWISFRSALRWWCDGVNWDPSSSGTANFPFVIRITQRLSQ